MTIKFSFASSIDMARMEDAFTRLLGAERDSDGDLAFVLQTPFQRDLRPLIGFEETKKGTRIALSSEPLPSIPYFGWLFTPFNRIAVRRQLRWAARLVRSDLEGRATPRRPGWGFLAPPARFTGEQGAVLATVSALSLVGGFGGSLFGQNVNFVAEAFDITNRDLGVSLAVTRVGVLVSFVASAMADRRGRRRLLLASVGGMALFNGLSAVAPDIVSFTLAQTAVRGLVSGALVIAGVMVVEEAPHGARAYSIAMLTLASGAGAALSTLLLFIGDLGAQAWRISFGISAVSLLFIPGFVRRLRETDRFIQASASAIKLGSFGQIVGRAYAGRFWILVVATFLLAVFSSPWFQFTNRYLAEEHGFSGLGITGFRAATQALPGLIGLIIGGKLAESYGRRPASMMTLAVSTLVMMGFFVSSGWTLWLTSAVGFGLEAAASIALGSFGIELFPTEVRGTANALLLVSGVTGSAAGLVAVGLLAEPLGSLGTALAILGVLGLAAVALIPKLPEAAGLTLEEISPSKMESK